jgi:hypothetical protein
LYFGIIHDYIVALKLQMSSFCYGERISHLLVRSAAEHQSGAEECVCPAWA